MSMVRPGGGDEASVSVVIPVRDRAALIGEAVRSVLDQASAGHGFGDVGLEVVVADDGSTDGLDETLAPLRRVEGARVVVVRGHLGAGSSGPGAARNRGIAAAQGRFIAFLDSDDAWLPGKLAVQLRAARAHPEAGLFCTAHTFFGDAVREERLDREERSMPDGLGKLWLWPFFLTSSVLVRRSLLERVGGFDESLAMAEDYDLYLRIVAIAPVHRTPEALVRIRRHRGNMTSEDRLRLALLRKRVVVKSLHREGERLVAELGARRVRHRLAHLDHTIAALQRLAGRPELAERYYAKALRHRPLWIKARCGALGARLASLLGVNAAEGLRRGASGTAGRSGAR